MSTFVIGTSSISEAIQQGLYPVVVSIPDRPIKKLIYVAGKYRDARGEWYVECNIREAERIAQYIWMNGAVAICPHKNTAHWGGICPDHVWLDGDLEILSRCDAIYMVSNWMSSDGAHKEKEFAEQMGLKVLYNQTELLKFLGIIA